MADRLAALLTQFELRFQLQAGPPQAVEPSAAQGEGHLHLLRAGALRWRAAEAGASWASVDHPSLLWFAGPLAHELEAPGAQLFCARVSLGQGNPLLQGLPQPWVLPLADWPQLDALLGLFFDEAAAERCGRSAVLERLGELLLIQLLRLGFQQGLLQHGALAGLADARLGKALTAVHDRPAHAWNLERLAAEAGLSRARFAALFNTVVGLPPGAYLSGLRMALAQRRLRQGETLKAVAPAVGYGSAGALAKAFQQHTGLTPSAWLAAQRAPVG